MKILLLLLSLSLPCYGVPLLSSSPFAPATLYLDFTSKANTVSDAQITTAWQTVVDGYSQFSGVNVTTVDPGDKGHVAWLEVGGSKPGVAGEAGVGTWFFGTSYRQYGGDFFAGFVYSDGLGDDGMLIGKVAVHEFGHELGLQHQSDYDDAGMLIREYSDGDATTVPWMGNILNGKTPIWNTGPDKTGVIVDTAAFISGQFALAPVPEPQGLLVFLPLVLLVRRGRI